MPSNTIRPGLAIAAAVLLSACKILPTGTVPGGDKPAAFDPDRMAAQMWDAKVMPYLKAKAGPFADVEKMAGADPAAAGAKYGNVRKQADSPWTYAATIEGKIVAANTKSRAATMDVDVDGDGKPDARIQIGPAIRGTALRDVLDFVDFNSFTNQIDYARFGKSLNTYANRTVLSKLPHADLEGRTAKVLGAFAAPSGTDLPLVTPVEAEIGPKP